MKQGTGLTRLVMVILFLAIVAYMVLSGMKTQMNPFKTVVVYAGVSEHSLTTEGWLFRDEERLAPASGLITYNFAEGGKMAQGQVAAVAYQSQEAMERQQQIDEINLRYDRLEYVTDEDSHAEKNLEKYLMGSIVSLQTSASRGDYTELETQTDELKRYAMRREYLYSETSAAEIDAEKEALEAELAAVKDSLIHGEMTTILATKGGVFSSFTDGYEELLSPELLFDAEGKVTVNNYLSLTATVSLPDNGAVGKVVSSNGWYLGLLVPEKDLHMYEDVYRVNVRFSSLGTTLKMSVYSISAVEDGEAVVLLYSRRNLPETMTLRQQSCDIIFRSDEGIRIPNNTLRVLEDGTAGVYTVTGHQAEFKPVRIIGEDGGHYIVAPNPKDAQDKRILRSGDEVIVTAAELYDGKVVR